MGPPVTEAERGGCAGPWGHSGVQRAFMIHDLMCPSPRCILADFWNGKEMLFIVLYVLAECTPWLIVPCELVRRALLPSHPLDKKTEAWRR